MNYEGLTNQFGVHFAFKLKQLTASDTRLSVIYFITGVDLV